MDAERYAKIKEIFQAVLESPPDERPRALDEACDGDSDLRREVERLIDSYESGYLEQPGFGNFVDNLTSDGLISGQKLGHYTVLEKIGSGGMGEVYLAEDGKLGRRVAIKLLPDIFTGDAERLGRFQQEARAASALNHPNIVTIYEIGDTDGKRYIATEFIDGETLRSRMHREKLSVSEALDIAVQSASAVAAAHEAGIIHRDIKPENIMIRRDGLVKVLDFGLAKLIETKQPAVISQDAPTERHIRTAPGMIMGTVQYMSPEQARGHPTDARTDIWSLGVVIYEMLAGTPPFKGETSADLIAEIVKTHPVPITHVVDSVPDRLDEIVAKTFEKNPNERYQVSKNLLTDLKGIERNLVLTNESGGPTAAEGNAANENLDGAKTRAMRAGSERTAEVENKTLSSAGVIVSEIKQHKLWVFGISAIFIALITGASFGLYRYGQLSSDTGIVATSPRADIKMQRLTADGKTESAAISGDGKLLTYVRDAGKGPELWVKQISTNSNLQLTKQGEMLGFGQITFSPTNEFVYFVAANSANKTPTIFRVPTLGGPVVRLLAAPLGSFSLSPDGDHLAFTQATIDVQAPIETRLTIADTNGRTLNEILTYKIPKMIADVAWSPNGKFIAFTTIQKDRAPKPTDSIEIVDLETKNVRSVTDTTWYSTNKLSWTPDSERIFMDASSTSRTADFQIWEVNIATGESRPRTHGVNNLAGTSMTADGHSIVSVERSEMFSIWVSDDGRVSGAREVFSGSGLIGMAWTRDDRVVYTSTNSGASEVWVMNSDGTGNMQLTNDRGNDLKAQPRVSPDGQKIVFSSTTANRHFWEMNVDGSERRQLTNSTAGEDSWATYSRDGKLLYFISTRSGRLAIWQLPLAGNNEPEMYLDVWAWGLSLSHDGTTLGYFVLDRVDGSWELELYSTIERKKMRRFQLPATIDFQQGLEWTPDDKGVVFVDEVDGVRNLSQQSIDGGRAVRLTNFTEPSVFDRRWSRDGKKVAMIRGQTKSDAVLITGFN